MNYILYSAYLPNLTDKNSHNQQVFSQLYYSLKTLYNTGYGGNVVIYYDSDITLSDFTYKNQYNIVKDFDFVLPIKFKYDNFLKTTTKGAYHKWQTATLFNKNIFFEQVLCVDNDTIFNRDPTPLFEKYNNKDVFYGKQYGPSEYDSIKNNLEINNYILNTGQFILSKAVLNKLGDNFLPNLLKEYIDVLRVTNKIQPEAENHMYWLGEEFAITKLLEQNNIPIISMDWFDSNYGVVDYDTTVCHYYSKNTKKILPEKYWSNFTQQYDSSYNFLN